MLAVMSDFAFGVKELAGGVATEPQPLGEERPNSRIISAGAAGLLVVGVDMSELDEETLKNMRFCDLVFLAERENAYRLNRAYSMAKKVPSAIYAEWIANTYGAPSHFGRIRRATHYLSTLRSDQQELYDAQFAISPDSEPPETPQSSRLARMGLACLEGIGPSLLKYCSRRAR